jgi:hypothetical protein
MPIVTMVTTLNSVTIVGVVSQEAVNVMPLLAGQKRV